MEVEDVRGGGAIEGIRGDSGTLPTDAVGLMMGWAVECLLWIFRAVAEPPSCGETIGDIGGVMNRRGSRLDVGLSGLGIFHGAVAAGGGRVERSFKSIGGGISSRLVVDTMGAAKARGEETEDGVEERVWYAEGGQ